MPLQSSLKERSTMGPRLTFGYAASLFLFYFDFGFALFGFDSCHRSGAQPADAAWIRARRRRGGAGPPWAGLGCQLV